MPPVYGLDVVNDVTGHGIHGTSVDGIGVVGQSSSSSPFSTAIYGHASHGTGMWGAGGGNGVIGAADENGHGVWGVSGGSSGVGVRGQGGVGVLGDVTAGTGVVGRSISGPGVIGTTSDPDGTGVVGVLGTSLGAFVERNPVSIVMVGAGVAGHSPNGTAIMGTVDGGPNGNGVAGAFDGDVVVTGRILAGRLSVTGHKSALVRHPDGSYRALYCMESPESWFEDFGRARIVRGKTAVKLDPGFVAIVRGDDYHIFLAPEGESQGLYVSRRSRSGFEVREQRRGTSTLPFSYRVVARRKDVTVRRFEKINLTSRPKSPGLPKGFLKVQLPIEDLSKIPERAKLPPPPQIPEPPKRAERTRSRARKARPPY